MYKITKSFFLLILVSYVYGIYKLNIVRCNGYDDFSINYLRYQYDYKHYPQFCDYNNNKFEFNNIEYLGYSLERYWSACNNENLDIKSYNQKTINLWENVWYDFGSCSNLNQYDYFNKSMILFYNLNHKYNNCFYYDYVEYCNYYYNDDLQPIYDNDNLRYII